MNDLANPPAQGFTAFDPTAWLSSLVDIGGGYALASGRKLWLVVEHCSADELTGVMAQVVGHPRPDRSGAHRVLFSCEVADQMGAGAGGAGLSLARGGRSREEIWSLHRVRRRVCFALLRRSVLMLCAIRGHVRQARNHVWFDGLDYRSSCRRCGKPLLRDDQAGWRLFAPDDYDTRREGKPERGSWFASAAGNAEA